APGAVTVTVTNPGAGPSNGLTFSFADTTTPKFNSFTISAKIVTITWSEPVCRPTTATNTAAQDWAVLNVSAQAANAVTADSTPVCTAALDNGVTTSTLTLTNAMPNGAFVETTLNSDFTGTGAGSTTRNTAFQDLAGNTASAPQARQATATAPETTQPFIASVSGAVGSTTLKFTFSEPIMCNQAGATTAWTYDSNDITL